MASLNAQCSNELLQTHANLVRSKALHLKTFIRADTRVLALHLWLGAISAHLIWILPIFVAYEDSRHPSPRVRHGPLDAPRAVAGLALLKMRAFRHLLLLFLHDFDHVRLCLLLWLLLWVKLIVWHRFGLLGALRFVAVWV